MKCISFTIILKDMKSGLKTGILEVLSDWSAEISPDALQQWTETGQIWPRRNKGHRPTSCCTSRINKVISKVLINHNIKSEVFMNGIQLEEVNSVKCTLEPPFPKKGSCTLEICIKITTATAAMAILLGFCAAASSGLLSRIDCTSPSFFPSCFMDAKCGLKKKL